MQNLSAHDAQFARMRDWRLPLLLGLFFLLFVTPLLGRKVGYTVDATPSFLLTQAILSEGVLFPQEISVKQGYIYSIAYIPFYLLGTALHPLFPDLPIEHTQRKMLCWMNILITALTIALVARALARLGFGKSAQAGVAALYGFGTLALFYARTDYNKSLAGLLLFSAFYVFLRFAQTRSNLDALVLGVVCGCLIALRLELGVVIPILLGFAWREAKSWRPVAIALAPVVVLGAFVVFYNWLYWDGAVAGGYEGGFSANPFPGVYGFLFSPGKSVWVFCPPLLLLPLLIRPFSYQVRVFFIPWALTCAAVFLLYSFWGNWWGGWGYGPRHLVPLLPLLALPLAAAFSNNVEQPPSAVRFQAISPPAWLMPVMLFLGLVGLVVQLLGALFDFNDIILTLMNRGVTESQLIWEPIFNPILHHMLALQYQPIERWDIGWVALWLRWGAPVCIALLTLWCAALGCVAWGIRREVQLDTIAERETTSVIQGGCE